MTTLIGLVSQKGGVGKSTLARLIARELAAAEYEVKIADLDIQQGTSHAWQARRQQSEMQPEIAVERFSTFSKAFKQSDHYDVMIFDGAPHATQATFEIARHADLTVIPTGLALDDLEPSVHLAYELKTKGIPIERIKFALVKVGDSAAELDEACSYLSKTGFDVLNGSIPEKTGYRRASDNGCAATETKFASLNARADEVAKSIIDAVSEHVIEEAA